MTDSFPTTTRRVLIAGAKFGEMYLNAFLQDQPGLELAGLLATGSARAQQLAHAFGTPLYTAIEQLPDDIDIACVVVRSTVVGGTGTALAEALLRRGMHVIQEHPCTRTTSPACRHWRMRKAGSTGSTATTHIPRPACAGSIGRTVCASCWTVRRHISPSSPPAGNCCIHRWT
ncbi:Gfo/Idh/MocA family oxidoreductase [Xanthomonas arboricola pv. corylina]|nr:Gfo/Idh/MocA family oxidoreductase [Xanthomonas arboricola pv. corylina]